MSEAEKRTRLQEFDAQFDEFLNPYWNISRVAIN